MALTSPTMSVADFPLANGRFRTTYLDPAGNTWYDDPLNPGSEVEIDSSIATGSQFKAEVYAEKMWFAYYNPVLSQDFAESPFVGTDIPRYYDGQNVWRVTSDEPGGGLGFALFTLASVDADSIVRNGNVVSAEIAGTSPANPTDLIPTMWVTLQDTSGQIGSVPIGTDPNTTNELFQAIGGTVTFQGDGQGNITVTTSEDIANLPVGAWFYYWTSQPVQVELLDWSFPDVDHVTLTVGSNPFTVGQMVQIVGATQYDSGSSGPTTPTFIGNPILTIDAVDSTHFTAVYVNSDPGASAVMATGVAIPVGNYGFGYAKVTAVTGPKTFQFFIPGNSTTFQQSGLVYDLFAIQPSASAGTGNISQSFQILSVNKTLTPNTISWYQLGPDNIYTGTDTIEIIPQTALPAGQRNAVVVFKMQNGAITGTSVPVTVATNGGSTYLESSSLPIGPTGTVARIVAFTAAGGNKYFYLTSAEIPAVASLPPLTSNGTVINDNTTTNFTFDFTDDALLAGTPIDVVGNNLFNQDVLSPCLGVCEYDGRLAWWGEINNIKNFVNMGFDGGRTGPLGQFFTLPLGWTARTGGGGGDGGGGGSEDGIFGAVVNHRGENYAVGDTGIVDAGHEDATYQIDSIIDVGPATNVGVPNRGTGYNTGPANTTPTTGTGTGLIIDILTVIPSGHGIGSYSITNGGSGYSIGDIGNIVGSGSGATYIVSAISTSGTGAVGTFHIVNPGNGYGLFTNVPTTNAGSQPGVGSGFTIDIFSVGVDSSGGRGGGAEALPNTGGDEAGYLVNQDPEYLGFAYQMTTGFNNLIQQSAYQDYYGAPILQPNRRYLARFIAKKNYSGSGNIVIDIASGPFASSAKANVLAEAIIPLSEVTTDNKWYVAESNASMPDVIPSDTLLRVYLDNTEAGGTVTIDELEIIDSDFPVLYDQAILSYYQNPFGYDLISGVLSVDPSEPLTSAFRQRGSFYLIGDQSLFQSQNNGTTEPNEWNVVQYASDCGGSGPNAVDFGEELSWWGGRFGGRIFDGNPTTRKITQELASIWEDINWTYQTFMWVRNDPINRMLLFGIPINGTEMPSTMLAMSYRLSDNAYNIPDPIHISQYSGRLICTDLGRRWSPWDRTINCAAVCTRPASSGGLARTIVFGQGTGSIPDPSSGGTLYRLDTENYPPLNPDSDSWNAHDDDYGQINSFYTTYFFFPKDIDQNPLLGLYRKLYHYLSAHLTGVGTIQITPYVDALTKPAPNLRPYTLTLTDTGYDIEWHPNVRGERVAWRFQPLPIDDSVDVAMALTHLQVTGRTDKVFPLRGTIFSGG